MNKIRTAMINLPTVKAVGQLDYGELFVLTSEIGITNNLHVKLDDIYNNVNIDSNQSCAIANISSGKLYIVSCNQEVYPVDIGEVKCRYLLDYEKYCS